MFGDFLNIIRFLGSQTVFPNCSGTDFWTGCASNRIFGRQFRDLIS